MGVVIMGGAEVFVFWGDGCNIMGGELHRKQGLIQLWMKPECQHVMCFQSRPSVRVSMLLLLSGHTHCYYDGYVAIPTM